MKIKEKISFDYSYLFEQALKSLNEDRPLEAYCLLEKVIDTNDSFAPAHACIGHLLAHYFGAPKLSELHLRRAKKLLPRDVEITYELVGVLVSQDKHEEARNLLSQLLKLQNIDKSILYYKLGIIAEKKEEIKEAQKLFNKAAYNSNELTDIQLIEDAIMRCRLKTNEHSF